MYIYIVGSYKNMSSVQVSKIGVYSVNIPVRVARALKLQKGENAIVRRGKMSNEFIVTIERD